MDFSLKLVKVTPSSNLISEAPEKLDINLQLLLIDATL